MGKSKNIIQVIIFAFFFSNVVAQNNVLFENIQKTKSEIGEFQQISTLLNQVKNNDVYSDILFDKQEIYFFSYNKDFVANLTKNINLLIPINNEHMELELNEVSKEFYNYQIVTSAGKKYEPNQDIKHYRGIIKNDKNSIVAMTFTEKEMVGLISTENGNYNILFDEHIKSHIMYNDKNIDVLPNIGCGNIKNDAPGYKDHMLFENKNTKNKNLDKIIRFYIETEFDIFQQKQTVRDVEVYITGLYNQVATLYQNEEINTVISSIFMWTTSDPYSATTTSSLLSQFQTNRTTINGDLGQLLTFRNIGGGIAASFSGLCNNSTKNKLMVAGINNTYSHIPNYSWSVFVVAHELGHLFGSRHTHACVWNGNNTAIDGCARYTEGSCDIPSIPSNGGTIMSYCHMQNVGINFNLGFGNQPGNIIRNNVRQTNCVPTLTGPSLICSQATYNIENLPTGATVQWSASNSNLSLLSGQGTSRAVFQKRGNGSTEVNATVSINNQSIALKKENIWVGEPIRPIIKGSDRDLGVGGQYHFYTEQKDNIISYEWTIFGDAKILYGETESFVSVVAQKVGGFSLMLREKNSCGWSKTAYRSCRVLGIENVGIFSVYPNPATSEISIEIHEPQEEKERLKARQTMSQTPYELQLWNATTMLKRLKTTEKTTQMHLGNFPKGIYFLHLIKDGKAHKQMIKLE